MEEDLSEHELEERLYSMLHHVDHTQNNLNDSHQNSFDVTKFVEDRPRSTLRRYWRTDVDYNPYQKVNTPKDRAPAAAKTTSSPENNRLKEESSAPPPPVDVSIFQSPVPQHAKKIIEYVEHEVQNSVVLESSDEDEVVEIALPPKPCITIESSDEDELLIVKPKSPSKTETKANSEHKSNSGEREVTASPVPSVVSSVSDEFIRSDCIALNISSRHPDKHSFDFSLHGSDLLVQNTPSKKKKRKKNKEAVTSTPINVVADKSANVAEGCFATPKSKAKNKKLKNKLTENLKRKPDAYDSDSNQSIVDTNKNKNLYVVTEKSLPSVDVYESDSNQSEIVREVNTDLSKNKNIYVAYSSDSSVSDDKPEETSKSTKKNNTLNDTSVETVDLTDNDNFISFDNTGICENIVMANVTGFSKPMNHGDENRNMSFNKDISMYVSSKVPSILNEDLDFDNLKGKEKVCKKRRYSLTTLRAEMEKFYNESWGGEEFNHREIQKNMSRDKSLWAIDPKDRMPNLGQRKPRCNYCNRFGHREDLCRLKPPICYMCGMHGHFEPRCPSKMCVNCGQPNYMYSTMCRNCSDWAHVKCSECGQKGHPATHCPDVWRRYHNTINTDVSLEMCTQSKKLNQLFCSGCSRRGHLVHACEFSLPFSGHSMNSPFVRFYRPIFSPARNNNKQPGHMSIRSKSFSEENFTTLQRQERNKRLSKSPIIHETHVNKKRNLSVDDETRNTKSPVVVAAQKNPPKEVVDTPKSKNKSKSLDPSPSDTALEKAPDFISISSSNHDNKGHVIQDNEVSDTSDAVTSARIYVTNDIINKIKTKEGEDWLKGTTGKLNVVVELAGINAFLSIRGKLADQEAFQSELREWTYMNTNKAKNSNNGSNNSDTPKHPFSSLNLPKNRNNLLRQLSKALDLLKEDLGDPRALYKELTFSQNKHEKLLRQKIISPGALSNSRTHINDMLRKLNIILIGQAGLADGTEHVNVLISFKEKLMNSRQKTIPPMIRLEIEDHYDRIFSSSARDDYSELMKKFYLTNSTQKLLKKKKHKTDQYYPYNTKFNKRIPSIENNERVINHNANENNEANTEGKKTNLLRKLLFCHRRLKSARSFGLGAKLKNEKQMVTRKVHTFIETLCTKETENVPSKMVKKVRRVQEQAQKFLVDV